MRSFVLSSSDCHVPSLDRRGSALQQSGHPYRFALGLSLHTELRIPRRRRGQNSSQTSNAIRRRGSEKPSGAEELERRWNRALHPEYAIERAANRLTGAGFGRSLPPQVGRAARGATNGEECRSSCRTFLEVSPSSTPTKPCRCSLPRLHCPNSDYYRRPRAGNTL